MNGVKEISEQIDWSKAPEGWDVFIAGQFHAGFYQDLGDRYEREGGYYRLKADEAHYTVFRRPWSGECLPPVGTVCNAHFMGCDQGVVEVRYSGQCVILWSDDRQSEQCGAAESYHFAPIRTPEQIAADEREAQIVAIHDAIVTSVKVTLGQCDSWRKVAEMVYNAGFKREQ